MTKKQVNMEQVNMEQVDMEQTDVEQADVEQADIEDYISMLLARIAELETKTAELEDKLKSKPTAQATSRKEQVLAFFANGAHVSISEIAKALGINNTNVSSVLSDLRKKDGLAIGTDSLGRKYIEQGGTV